VDNTTIIVNDFRQLEIFGSKYHKSKSAQNKGFDEEIAAFVGAIEKGNEPPIPFNEIVESTLVTFAVHNSLDTGSIVNLKYFADEFNLSF